ncbi:hypothetical protein ACTXT7_012861 [Hymenolepis weldensis]
MRQKIKSVRCTKDENKNPEPKRVPRSYIVTCRSYCYMVCYEAHVNVNQGSWSAHKLGIPGISHLPSDGINTLPQSLSPSALVELVLAKLKRVGCSLSTNVPYRINILQDEIPNLHFTD